MVWPVWRAIHKGLVLLAGFGSVRGMLRLPPPLVPACKQDQLDEHLFDRRLLLKQFLIDYLLSVLCVFFGFGMCWLLCQS